MNEKGISREERIAFVAGAMMACAFAKLSIEDMTTVLDKMRVTPDEVWQGIHALETRQAQ